MKITASDIKVNDFPWAESADESIAVTNVKVSPGMVIVTGLASVEDPLTGLARMRFFLATDQVSVSRGAGRTN